MPKALQVELVLMELWTEQAPLTFLLFRATSWTSTWTALRGTRRSSFRSVFWWSPAGFLVRRKCRIRTVRRQ